MHVYGYVLGLSPMLLFFPFLFSVLWAFYSRGMAHKAVKKLKLLNGHKQAKITSLTFFGNDREIDVNVSNIQHVLVSPNQQRKGAFPFDVIGEQRSWTSTRHRRRFVLESTKGKIYNETLLKYFLYKLRSH